MGKASRAKGIRGEQAAAIELFRAWEGVDPPKVRDYFIRTGTGSRQPCGDILCPPDFPFYVSVKNVAAEGLQPHNLLLGGMLIDWWEEVCAATATTEKRVLLIWKALNGRWWCVWALGVEGAEVLGCCCDGEVFLWRAAVVAPFSTFCRALRGLRAGQKE